jgi:hypothetical protein
MRKWELTKEIKTKEASWSALRERAVMKQRNNKKGKQQADTAKQYDFALNNS